MSSQKANEQAFCDPLTIAVEESTPTGDCSVGGLVDRLYRPLVEHVHRRLALALLRRFDGEDVAQDAFLVFLRYASIHPEVLRIEHSAQRHLLFRIADNCIRNLIHRHRAGCRDVRAEVSVGSVDAGGTLIARCDPVSTTVVCQDLVACVAAKFVDPTHRRIVHELLDGQMTPAIAQSVGCSLRTVQRIRAALLCSLEAGLNEHALNESMPHSSVAPVEPPAERIA
jgi:hypothetical protein